MSNTSSRKSFRGTLYLMIAQIAVMGGSYVIAVALARGLGPELYGVYGIVYSVLLSVELVGRLGFPQATAKLIAESDSHDHKHEATGFSLALVVYCSIFALFWLGSGELASIFNVPDGERLFKIAALDIPFYGMYFMLIHIFSGRRQFLQQSLSNIVYIATKVVGIFILFYIGPTVTGALYINALGSVIALLFIIPLVGLKTFRISFRHAQPLLRLAGPVALIALGTQVLMGVDLWLLNALGTDVPPTVRGYYVAAVNIARVPSLVSFVLTSVLVPTVAKAIKDEDDAQLIRTLDGTVRFMFIGLLASGAFISVNSTPIMTLLFSTEFANGAAFLSILVFSQGCLLPIYMVLANVLFAGGYALKSAMLSMILVLLALLTCGFLVTWAGAYGAALGSLISALSAGIAIFFLLKRYLGFVASWQMIAKCVIAVAGLGLASFMMEFRGIALVAELVIVGALYLGLLFVLGLISRSDIHLLLPAKPISKPSSPSTTVAHG